MTPKQKARLLETERMNPEGSKSLWTVHIDKESRIDGSMTREAGERVLSLAAWDPEDEAAAVTRMDALAREIFDNPKLARAGVIRWGDSRGLARRYKEGPMNTDKNKQAGFSLVETLIVIVILAVLAVAAGGFIHWARS